MSTLCQADIHRKITPENDMLENSHFKSATSWRVATEKLNFKPLVPRKNFRHNLKSLRIYVRDYKMRELPIDDRSLEAYFESFVFTQAQKIDANEAKRQTVKVPYGSFGREVFIAGHVGRAYELGPEPPADDIDGRSPSVVVWHNGNMFYLLASDEMFSNDLVKIADSIYG